MLRELICPTLALTMKTAWPTDIRRVSTFKQRKLQRISVSRSLRYSRKKFTLFHSAKRALKDAGVPRSTAASALLGAAGSSHSSSQQNRVGDERDRRAAPPIPR
jgi:hypothetical protein